MSSKSSRRGILVVLAAIVAGGALNDSDTGTVFPSMPSDDILEIPSGETVTISSSSSDTYSGINWEQGGALNWEQGGSIQLENTA